MAVAGCFGGPLFNLLIGLGASLIQYVKVAEHPKLVLDHHAIIALITLLISLPLTLAVLVRHEFRFPRGYGYALLGIYGMYTLLNLLL